MSDDPIPTRLDVIRTLAGSGCLIFVGIVALGVALGLAVRVFRWTAGV